MVVSRQVLKPTQDTGAGGAAMLFSVLGFLCLPLGIVGWAMGKPGSGARLVGMIATIVQVIIIIVVTAGAFGMGNAPPEELPPAPPTQFFEEDASKPAPKK